MEILIAVAVIIVLYVIFNSGGGEPNVENFTVDQMIRHVKSLQNWIIRHQAIQNPSESVKAELQRKRSQYDHAMAVWMRKIEEPTNQGGQSAPLAKSMDAIERELAPITGRAQQLANEGKSEPEAIAAALKEWHESNKQK